MKAINKYWFIFMTQIGNSMAYPAELIGRGLLMIPFMWIFTQLWRVTFASTNTSVINGLSLHDTLWYLVIAETVELSRPRLANTISDAVKDGSIAYFLNKPYDFLLYHYSSSMGETLFRALINFIIGAGMIFWLIGSPPTIYGWPMVMISLLGAWTVNYCISAMIGLSAFILEDISAIQWIYQKLAFILGGLLIPLDFYPGWLQVIARALPFSAITYAPARLFVNPSIAFFASVFLQQVIWIMLLGGALTLIYRQVTRSLAINGG